MGQCVSGWVKAECEDTADYISCLDKIHAHNSNTSIVSNIPQVGLAGASVCPQPITTADTKDLFALNVVPFIVEDAPTDDVFDALRDLAGGEHEGLRLE